MNLCSSVNTTAFKKHLALSGLLYLSFLCCISIFSFLRVSEFSSVKQLGVTALAYSDALTLGVGTQTGQVCADFYLASTIDILLYLLLYYTVLYTITLTLID